MPESGPWEAEPLNLYRNLISNTVLFGISTFGARFLTFLLTLLTPFYTRVLSSAEYGITDLLIQTGNLITPIASVGIANGVIRYGLERSSNKASVFTTGILVTLAGFFVLALISPPPGPADVSLRICAAGSALCAGGQPPLDL